MKKLSMKTLLTYSIAMLGLFGIVRAEETTTTEPASAVTVSGELSTDITFGDATTFASPYTGLTFSGDGWVLSTNLSDGLVNVEEVIIDIGAAKRHSSPIIVHSKSNKAKTDKSSAA